MAIPLTRGRPYQTDFTTSGALSPSEDGTIVGLNIGPKYSFIAGNSVLISGYFVTSVRFEAVVSQYDSTTGELSLSEITNIKGFPSAITRFNISLTGSRGSKIISGSGTPSNNSGRSGDMYIDSSSGVVYLKS